MKCPRCSSTHIWKSGKLHLVSGTAQMFQCAECKRCFQDRYFGPYFKDKKLTPEHRKKCGQGYRRHYWNWSEKPQRKISKAERETRSKNKKHSPDRERKGFIGMLGDIEVYVLNTNGLGRKPQGLSSGWARPAHGKPELKKLKPT